MPETKTFFMLKKPGLVVADSPSNLAETNFSLKIKLKKKKIGKVLLKILICQVALKILRQKGL